MWLLQLQTLFVIVLAFQQVQPQEQPTNPPTESSTVVPIPAPKITAFRCGDTEAEIAWKSLDNTGKIYHYTIEYSTKFTPDVWCVAAENIDKTTYKVSMNARGVTFLFRVIAIDIAGQSSEPSEMNLDCVTEPDVPYETPENVKMTETTPGTFVVSWTPIPQIEHNGPGFYYLVSWRMTGKKEWNKDTVTDWKQNQLVKQPNEAFHEYECKVEAFNKLGKSKSEATVEKGYPGEGRPFLAPSQFQISGMEGVIDNHAEVELQWKPLPQDSFNGHPRGYKIQLYWNSGFDASYYVRYGTNKLKIKRLSLNTVYNANIQAVNSLFQGPTSNLIQFETPQGVPDQVTNFKATVLGSSAILFKWNKPEYCNGNQLIGYNIYYEEINGGSSQQRIPQINDPNIIEAKLSGLKESTAYRFHIAAKNELGEGKDVYIETKTKEATKPDVPEFSIDSNDGNVRVNWTPKIDGNPGSKFYVKYRIKGTEEWEKTIVIINDNFIVIKLESKKTYEVVFVSVDGDYETESEIKEFPESSSVEFDKAKITIIVVVSISVVSLIAIFIKCCLCKKLCPHLDV